MMENFKVNFLKDFRRCRAAFCLETSESILFFETCRPGGDPSFSIVEVVSRCKMCKLSHLIAENAGLILLIILDLIIIILIM